MFKQKYTSLIHLFFKLYDPATQLYTPTMEFRFNLVKKKKNKKKKNKLKNKKN